jgi:hypothetical protein
MYQSDHHDIVKMPLNEIWAAKYGSLNESLGIGNAGLVAAMSKYG